MTDEKAIKEEKIAYPEVDQLIEEMKETFILSDLRELATRLNTVDEMLMKKYEENLLKVFIDLPPGIEIAARNLSSGSIVTVENPKTGKNNNGHLVYYSGEYPVVVRGIKVPRDIEKLVFAGKINETVMAFKMLCGDKKTQ